MPLREPNSPSATSLIVLSSCSSDRKDIIIKILTQQKRVPWIWAVIVLYPWFVFIVREQISVVGITFTLKKFTDNPSLIGFIGSSNQAFGFLVGSLCSFVSDRIWTKYGRRRPFLLISSFGAAILCFMIPQISSLWLIVIVIVSYQFIVDFSTPFEPFANEVIPSRQRGRAGAITQAFKAVAFGLVYAGLIGGFDKVYNLPTGIQISGEQVMYWLNSILLLSFGFLVLFLFREIKPENATIYKLREVPVLSIFKELVKPDMLPLLGLAFVLQNLWIGLGPYEPLLVTEQWGYSKMQYGQIMSIGMIITVLIVPIGGWISDKYDRLLLLKVGLVVVLLIKLTFYVYVEFLTPGRIPPYSIVLAVGLIKGAVASFMAVACIPLIFDYTSSNRFGTLSAGMGIVFSLITFVGVNAIGTWINFSARHVFRLPENTYNYMAGYHWLFLMGLLGLAYLFYFSKLDRTGRISKILPEPVDNSISQKDD